MYQKYSYQNLLKLDHFFQVIMKKILLCFSCPTVCVSYFAREQDYLTAESTCHFEINARSETVHNRDKIIMRFERYPNLRSSCGGLFKRMRSKRRRLSLTFYAKNYICRMSWFISSNCGAIYCSTMRRSLKSKNPIYRFQGRLRSSALAPLKSLSAVLVVCLMQCIALDRV